MKIYITSVKKADNAPTDQALALLEEAVKNGAYGKESLWNWFNGEYRVICQTIQELASET